VTAPGRERLAVSIRPVEPRDAEPLAALYRAQRGFLEPWEPVRSEAFFTVAGQRREIDAARVEARAGRLVRFVILAGDVPVGSITASAIARGPFASARLGYFVAEEWNGRGIASEAVRHVADWAFEQAGLHRLSAGTLLENAGSQRVLARNGFRIVGIARNYLHIAGRWQDHVLFARTAEDPPIDRGDPRELIATLDRLLP
jgi:[ribosomal protein S5]-alanine N-acetyltransferase